MRVAVKANLTPACGGSRPLPEGLSRTNRPRSADLVAPGQRAPAARRNATARAVELPRRVSETADWATASVRRDASSGVREISTRSVVAPFISSRRLSATPPVRGELLI